MSKEMYKICLKNQPDKIKFSVDFVMKLTSHLRFWGEMN